MRKGSALAAPYVHGCGSDDIATRADTILIQSCRPVLGATSVGGCVGGGGDLGPLQL